MAVASSSSGVSALAIMASLGSWVPAPSSWDLEDELEKWGSSRGFAVLLAMGWDKNGKTRVLLGKVGASGLNR